MLLPASTGPNAARSRSAINKEPLVSCLELFAVTVPRAATPPRRTKPTAGKVPPHGVGTGPDPGQQISTSRPFMGARPAGAYMPSAALRDRRAVLTP
jgi:hypothetical protein